LGSSINIGGFGGFDEGAAVLDPVGFWSYTRNDDQHSDGQLSQQF
jgi:hypothetical protein